MDPLAHTLLGATLARTRLGRDRALALPTLVLAANVADIDVVAYFWSSDAALAFRRGITHGPLGLALLPALVAVVVWLIGRRRAPRPASGVDRDRPGGAALDSRDWPHRRVGYPGPAHRPAAHAEPQKRSSAGYATRSAPAATGAVRPATLGSLLGLAYLGALTHPALDWLNTYGVRFLHPFDRRWFYGDTLFIIDPWLWLVLGVAVLLSRRRARWPSTEVGRRRMATAGVAALGIYLAASIAAAAASRGIVSDAVAATIADPVTKLMVGPLPLTPARREVVVETADAIRHGSFRWTAAPRLEWDDWSRPRPAPSPVLAAAMRDPSIQGFLGWARFLFVEIDEKPEHWEVHLMDARYTLERGAPFGSAMVRVPRQP